MAQRAIWHAERTVGLAGITAGPPSFWNSTFFWMINLQLPSSIRVALLLPKFQGLGSGLAVVPLTQSENMASWGPRHILQSSGCPVLLLPS